MFKALALALLVLVAVTSLAAQDGAVGTTGGPRIKLRGCMYYQHADFGGGRNSILEGVRRQLGSDWNDEISSIACNPYLRSHCLRASGLQRSAPDVSRKHPIRR